MKELLLDVLEQPGERAAGLRLADFLQKQGDPHAARLRRSYETGFIYFGSNGPLAPKWSSASPEPVYLTIQLLPHKLAVEAAHRCAAHVLPVFERVHPGDSRARSALAA